MKKIQKELFISIEINIDISNKAVSFEIPVLVTFTEKLDQPTVSLNTYKLH